MSLTDMAVNGRILVVDDAMENIQILQWGDPNASLRMLQAHQGYRHIRRMVLELEGNDAAAASLE